MVGGVIRGECHKTGVEIGGGGHRGGGGDCMGVIRGGALPPYLHPNPNDIKKIALTDFRNILEMIEFEFRNKPVTSKYCPGGDAQNTHTRTHIGCCLA